MKRGTEDLDFFIGDEALAAANGPGMGFGGLFFGTRADGNRLWDSLPNPPWTS